METVKDFRLVYCNTSDLLQAKTISKKLIEDRLAACCSISSKVISLYNWDNKLVEDEEFTIMIKTHKIKLNMVEEAIRSLHTYDVPEIICVELTEANTDYLNWMKTEMDLK